MRRRQNEWWFLVRSGRGTVSKIHGVVTGRGGGGVFICGKGEGGWEEVYPIVGVQLFLLGSRC